MIKTSRILWQGKSPIDNAPIMAIVTWDSANEKTGNMIQTWIIRSDMKPNDAVKTGQDSSICGDCVLRPMNKEKRVKLGIRRPCYVKTYNAPRSIYEAFKRNRYIHGFDGIPDLPIRLGSYGDPVNVPITIWDQLIGVHNQKHTGYTHQWRHKVNQEYKRLLMASIDNNVQLAQAIKLGWRCFAVNHGTGYTGKLASCPASKESNYIKSCIECKACNGVKSDTDSRSSIVINAH